MNTLKNFLPYVKYIVFVGVVATLTLLFVGRGSKIDELTQAMELYQRQVAGQLTEKERQFQAANNELGIAQSKLMKQEDLLKVYEKEKIKTNAEFEKYKKQYKIELEAFHRTIAQLEQQIRDGKTEVTPGNRGPNDPPADSKFDKPIDPRTTKLEYKWNSGDGRFDLYDPDVFSSNNETFKLKQNFRITGEIYREQAGFLKTQRIQVEEVVEDGKNEDGSQKYKTVGEAKVVESKFNYTERAPDSWIPRKSVFGVWGTIGGHFALNNGLNPRFVLATGVDFLQWKGLGVGINLLFDTNEWKESGFGISLSYRPIIRSTQLNVGISLGLGTQFKQPFQSYIPTLGLTFYLW